MALVRDVFDFLRRKKIKSREEEIRHFWHDVSRSITRSPVFAFEKKEEIEKILGLMKEIERLGISQKIPGSPLGPITRQFESLSKSIDGSTEWAKKADDQVSSLLGFLDDYFERKQPMPSSFSLTRRATIAGAAGLLASSMNLPGRAFANTAPLKIVLDDAGAHKDSIAHLKALQEKGYPLTIAVLPYNHYKNALEILSIYPQASIFLHQPMEPIDMVKRGLETFVEPNRHSPDRTGMYVTDEPEACVKIIERNIGILNDELGKKGGEKIIGFNNHTGSLLTQSKPHMSALAHYARKNNLLVLDSRTIASTVLYEEAINAGARASFRNYPFIDDGTATHLHICAEHARRGEVMIPIGHIQKKPTVMGILEMDKDKPLLGTLQ